VLTDGAGTARPALAGAPVPVVVHPDPRAALGALSARIHGDPSTATAGACVLDATASHPQVLDRRVVATRPLGDQRLGAVRPRDEFGVVGLLGAHHADECEQSPSSAAVGARAPDG